MRRFGAFSYGFICKEIYRVSFPWTQSIFSHNCKDIQIAFWLRFRFCFFSLHLPSHLLCCFQKAFFFFFFLISSLCFPLFLLHFCQQEQQEAQAFLMKICLQKPYLQNFRNFGKFLLDVATQTLTLQSLWNYIRWVLNGGAKGTFLMRKVGPVKFHGPFAKSGASRTSVRKEKCIWCENKYIFSSGNVPSWVALEFFH